MYQVTTDEYSQPQIEALPPPARAPFAEARVVLEVNPWSGESLNAANPDAEVRTLTFGPTTQGMITYLILEDQRRVDCGCPKLRAQPVTCPFVRGSGQA